MDSSRFLHPILSGFPATLVVLLLAAEGFSMLTLAKEEPKNRELFAIRRFLVIALVVSVVASFLSGYSASNLLGEVTKKHEELISSHHSFGKLVLVNSIVLAAFFWLAQIANHGRIWFRLLYLVALIFQLSLSFVTGSKGGEMVFDHAIGVRNIEIDRQGVTEHPDSQKPEATPTSSS